jgi:hypothetical protein
MSVYVCRATSRHPPHLTSPHLTSPHLTSPHLPHQVDQLPDLIGRDWEVESESWCLGVSFNMSNHHSDSDGDDSPAFTDLHAKLLVSGGLSADGGPGRVRVEGIRHGLLKKKEKILVLSAALVFTDWDGKAPHYYFIRRIDAAELWNVCDDQQCTVMHTKSLEQQLAGNDFASFTFAAFAIPPAPGQSSTFLTTSPHHEQVKSRLLDTVPGREELFRRTQQGEYEHASAEAEIARRVQSGGTLLAGLPLLSYTLNEARRLLLLKARENLNPDEAAMSKALTKGGPADFLIRTQTKKAAKSKAKKKAAKDKKATVPKAEPNASTWIHIAPSIHLAPLETGRSGEHGQAPRKPSPPLETFDNLMRPLLEIKLVRRSYTQIACLCMDYVEGLLLRPLQRPPQEPVPEPVDWAAVETQLSSHLN